MIAFNIDLLVLDCRSEREEKDRREVADVHNPGKYDPPLILILFTRHHPSSLVLTLPALGILFVPQTNRQKYRTLDFNKN